MVNGFLRFVVNVLLWKLTPPQPSPAHGAKKGTKLCPSLARSAGEGWGGVKPLPLQWLQAGAKPPSHLLLSPDLTPIQLPIANRLGQVQPLDRRFTGEIGNRPRHSQNPVHRACGQLQSLHRLFKQVAVSGGQRAVPQRFRLPEMSVGLARTLQLSATCLHHPLAYGGAAFTCAGIAAQFARRQAWHLQVQVNAIQQRAGNACAVAADAVGRATAAPAAVAGPAALAGVEGFRVVNNS